MTLKLLNRATTVLAASIGTSDATLAVQASTGAKLPSLAEGKDHRFKQKSGSS